MLPVLKIYQKFTICKSLLSVSCQNLAFSRYVWSAGENVRNFVRQIKSPLFARCEFKAHSVHFKRASGKVMKPFRLQYT
jgi:hypothetical protein